MINRDDLPVTPEWIPERRDDLSHLPNPYSTEACDCIQVAGHKHRMCAEHWAEFLADFGDQA